MRGRPGDRADRDRDTCSAAAVSDRVDDLSLSDRRRFAEKTTPEISYRRTEPTWLLLLLLLLLLQAACASTRFEQSPETRNSSRISLRNLITALANNSSLINDSDSH